MVSPVTVCPSPSKVPVKVAAEAPIGENPLLLFQVDVPLAAMSAPST